MVSLMEVPVAWLVEKGHVRRPVAAVVTGATMFALGVLATLSQGPVLAHVKVFGMTFFDLFDFLSSNVLLPVGGLAIAIVGGWLVSRQGVQGRAEQGLRGGRPGTAGRCTRFVRFVAPALILLILLNSLGVLRLA